MKRTLTTTMLLSAIVAVSHAQEQGPLQVTGSLFKNGSGAGMIGTRTARHKGDLLTIIVSEQQTGSQAASTTATKTDASTYSTSLPAVTAVTNQFLTGLLKNVSNGALAGGSTNGTSSNAGAGTTSTSSAYSTTLTVQVMEVTEQGNLIVEGKKTLKMNKQTQTLLVQGIVRPDDILPNNSILSQNVADLRLLAEGKGLIANRQHESILTKLLSWIF
ncbi:MAG TPA: flagellar basal body L-ring protein FlgH [Fimbriimonas sp.]|nr:flagellar basal body L-ring protein FlgH [Fimbriimonas sp.]